MIPDTMQCTYDNKTAYLKVENSILTAFRFSPVTIHAHVYVILPLKCKAVFTLAFLPLPFGILDRNKSVKVAKIFEKVVPFQIKNVGR